MKVNRFLVALLGMLCWSSVLYANLRPTYLRTEYKETPFTDVRKPRLSWELTATGYNQKQTAYQILVATSPDKLVPGKADLWDTGKVPSNATSHILYDGKPLQSRQRCYWRVRSWDGKDVVGNWSPTTYWEMALLERSEWKGEWVGMDLDHLGKGPTYHLPPAPFVRNQVAIKPGFKKARLYVTALGLYEFSINGKRVGKDYFTPGWTDYDQRLYYQVYDVSNHIKGGQNALASELSYGWYAGYLGYALLVGNPVVRGFYGKVPAVKAQLEVEYPNGKIETFTTNNGWKANYGPLLESDILNGETYDARKELTGWNKVGYNDSKWQPVTVVPDKADRKLEVYPGPPVTITGELSTKHISKRPDGEYIFDLGQNFAGIVRIKVKGNAGDTIQLRFGEKLHPDGRLMTENLRMARATDTYILKGNPAGEVWEPKFTFHGFQYVAVKGLRKAPVASDLVGLVIGSDTPQTGTFETDSPMINQLYSNIDWTQRANYLDIPTDCPQRDERMGWTADAHVYARSAMFNRDVASFFTKWIKDLNDSQWPNGAYPLYSPRPNVRATDSFSPGWMEAGIICPYQTYDMYGDTRVIEESWPYMEKFMQFMEQRSNNTYVFKEKAFDDISPKGGFGDWLSFGTKTSPDILASFHYAYCADLMAIMAEAINNKAAAEKYKGVAQKVRSATLQHYYNPSNGQFKVNTQIYGKGEGYVDGELGFHGHTQTAYANAIYMNLLDTKGTEAAGKYLRELIQSNNNLLATGFLGAKAILPALSATGNSDVAYRLFLSKEFPSWGFEVMNGSTSIWERWDSFTLEDGFRYNASMNSFSHYSFGAVCEWMFENAAGIQRNAPGFSQIKIRPEIAPSGLNYLQASYRTLHGNIKSGWQKTDKGLKLDVTIPVNTSALIYVPAQASSKVLFNGKAASSFPGLSSKGYDNGYQVYEAGSGNYAIQVTN